MKLFLSNSILQRVDSSAIYARGNRGTLPLQSFESAPQILTSDLQMFHFAWGDVSLFKGTFFKNYMGVIFSHFAQVLF